MSADPAVSATLAFIWSHTYGFVSTNPEESFPAYGNTLLFISQLPFSTGQFVYMGLSELFAVATGNKADDSDDTEPNNKVTGSKT